MFDIVHDDLMVTDVSDSHLNTKSDNSLSVPTFFMEVSIAKRKIYIDLHQVFALKYYVRYLKPRFNPRVVNNKYLLFFV